MAERFQLTFHHEQRELAYYAVTIAKGGPKLAVSKAAASLGSPDETWNTDGKQVDAKFTNNQMSEFALGMQSVTDRPVVDETGLKGSYDFTLRWLQNDTQASDADTPPMLFSAVQEQLGLKLVPKKGMVDALRQRCAKGRKTSSEPSASSSL